MIPKVFLYLMISVLLLQEIVSASFCNNNSHLNEQDACVCNEGYEGSECQHCEGRFILTDSHGIVTDGADSPHFVNCLPIISPVVSTNATLHIRFIKVEGACKCDFLKVFDGDSINGPLLATFYGDINPFNPPEVLSNTGSVTLQFSNDERSFFSQGYNIYYWVQENNNSAGAGNAEFDTKRQGRATTDITLLNETVYMFGGFTTETSSAWKDFISINTTTMELELVESFNNTIKPVVRHDHTLVAWHDYLLMYGGAFANNTITNEMWKYDTKQSSWQLLDVNSTPPLMGHSAHLTQSGGRDIMLVFFGYHPQWALSPFVFQFNVDTLDWSEVVTSGAYRIGTYGHASTIDRSTNTIYIHGGFHFDVSTNNLYSYDVDMCCWTILPASTDSRYLHSMALLDNSLFIFGGKLTTPGFLDCKSCSNLESMVYDIECKTWNKTEVLESERYGQSAVELNTSTMLIFGGYDGTILDDIILYGMSLDVSCGNKNQSECENPQTCFGNETEYESETNCEDCLSAPCLCCYQNTEDGLSNCAFQTKPCEQETCNGNGSPDRLCSNFRNCDLCHNSGCSWNGDHCMPKPENETDSSATCPTTCAYYSSCSQCAASPECTWCASTDTCFQSGTIPVIYPFGTCTNYLSSESQIQFCETDPCLQYQDCDDCFKNEQCGWCDHGSVTGYGTCLSGSSHAPLNVLLCPAEQWNFLKCPDCQCNGHSICASVEEPAVCTHCDAGTIGMTCDQCDTLYYGNPTNGRNCTECQCNNHAYECSNVGSCRCFVEGISGVNCDRCSSEKFGGNAVNDTCFYIIDVMTEYRYPFYSDGRVYPRELNFASCPDYGADISINLVATDPVNFTVTTNSTQSFNETIVASSSNTTNLVVNLQQSFYQFGSSQRPCIRIYVAEIIPNNLITVSLLQYRTNIVMLIAVFFVCFISLLLLALVIWKGNNLIMRAMRRRNARVEMQRLAARPMSVVHYDCKKEHIIETEKRKVDAICEEILFNSDVVICSTLLCLPSANNDTSSKDLVVGSCMTHKKLYTTVNAEASSSSTPRHVYHIGVTFHNIFSSIVRRSRRLSDVTGFNNVAYNMDSSA